MLKIATSAFIDFLRKSNRSVPTIGDCERTDWETEPHGDGTVRGLEAMEAKLDLDVFLRRLPLDEAATLLLFKRDRYSYEEIAGQMGVCPATVRNRLARAAVKCMILAADTKFRGSAK